MWEHSQANPQLLFDVGLEIAASWQRLLAGICVQQGQTFPGCKPADIFRLRSSFEDFHPLQGLCLEWSEGCRGTCVQTTDRSQPMSGTMKPVPWETFLRDSCEELQIQQTPGPRGWAVTSGTHWC